MDLASLAHDLLRACNRFLEARKWKKRERGLRPLERALRKGLQAAFRAHAKRFLQQFAALEGRFPAAASEALLREAIVPADWEAFLYNAGLETFLLFLGPLDEAVRAALLRGGYATMAELAIPGTFSLANPRAVNYMWEHGANLVTKINETTRGYIRTVITKGIDEGWSYNEMARAITDRYEEFAVGRPQLHIRSRAHMIAVTETGNAYEEGSRQVVQRLQDHGLEMEKFWLTSGGPVCEKICLPNNAAGWIPVADVFPSGHDRPLGHPACRCGALYRRIGAGQT